jgi:hypothetical protein
MCEHQANLIAWLDEELSPIEAAAVARHVESCESCRARFASLQNAGENFRLYRDAIFAANSKPKLSRWAPALAAAALVAAASLFLIFPRKHAPIPPPTPAPISTATNTPAVAPQNKPAPSPAPRKTSRPRRANSRQPRATATWHPTETAVQIAIPADAMFAPGAVPPGMNFFAEMSIAPDGSIRQVRLRQ